MLYWYFIVWHAYSVVGMSVLCQMNINSSLIFLNIFGASWGALIYQGILIIGSRALLFIINTQMTTYWQIGYYHYHICCQWLFWGCDQAYQCIHTQRDDFNYSQRSVIYLPHIIHGTLRRIDGLTKVVINFRGPCICLPHWPDKLGSQPPYDYVSAWT